MCRYKRGVITQNITRFGSYKGLFFQSVERFENRLIFMKKFLKHVVEIKWIFKKSQILIRSWKSWTSPSIVWQRKWWVCKTTIRRCTWMHGSLLMVLFSFAPAFSGIYLNFENKSSALSSDLQVTADNFTQDLNGNQCERIFTVLKRIGLAMERLLKNSA